MSLAYLVDSEKLYFAQHPDEDLFATSAVVRLIQGVYARDPDNALRLVRNRIFSSAPATEMCHGMVKVAAKRLTDSVSEKSIGEIFAKFSADQQIDVSESFNALTSLLPYERELEQNLSTLIREKPQSPRDWMAVARKLIRPSEGLPVAALLISADNQILSAALNCNSKNRTLHAEVNLIQCFYRNHRKKIPSGSKIITTLKACKMCAAMIWSSAEQIESTEIFFGEMDEGKHARETVLNPGTFERKRASHSASQLVCEIERQLR